MVGGDNGTFGGFLKSIEYLKVTAYDGDVKAADKKNLAWKPTELEDLTPRFKPLLAPLSKDSLLVYGGSG